MADLVLLRRPADGVAVVTLNRPAKYNALSAGLLADLRTRLAELARDAGLRALVLTGADEQANRTAQVLADALQHGRYVEVPGDHFTAKMSPEFWEALSGFLAE